MAKPSFHKISSWDDFEKKLTTLNKKEKGDYFEYLTKYYLKIDVKYQSYDEVWLLSELPNKEREYLGFADKSDIGIDLIAKNGNEYYAIQCKYHSDFNSSVTRNEIAPFLTMLESNPKITNGFVVSTANTKSPKIKRSISKPLSYLLHDTWDNLSDKFFKDIQAMEKGKAIKPSKPLSPRPHQKKALKDAVKHFEKENEERGKLIFPCGAGKSLTGFWMTQQLKSKATLIAVPSLSLVKQTLEVYLQEIHAHGKTVKWLCICSDDGIGKTDDVVYYTEDLGVPCETDPEFIEQWLKENQDDDLVVFTTYQSGRIIADISQKLDFTFDVGIYDEAHKTVGSNKKLFSHLLFEENISVRKRIFMTATERFYGGSKDDIISMDDMGIYGDTFSQMSFKEAIESNLLTDYKVITIDVKKSEISEFIRTNNLIQLNDKWKKETEARSLASMLALRKAMKKFDIKNAVSFHSSIEKAVRNKELQRHITDTYNFQPIDTFTVSGKQGTTKRNQIVKEFAESSKALITNAKCLTEGVDVPNIDCIVFSDPRKSKVDIVQALGRALRKKDGKEWGYVVLPVIYDEKTNEIDNDNFDEILAIVRGLASNDERIVEYFKDKNQKEKKGTREGSQFQLDVVSDYMDEEELTKQLEIRLWEKLSRFNWMPFEEAREIVSRMQIKSGPEYRIAWKKGLIPKNIPGNPRGVYRDSGFSSMPNFLGYESFLQDWLPYDEARKIVHKLNLKSVAQWREYVKKKPIRGIHNYPPDTYQDVWLDNGGWSGFLGKKMSPQERARFQWPYNKAKEYVWGLKLQTGDEWNAFTKSDDFPIFLPMSPQITYEEWVGIEEWLGPTYLPRNKRKQLNYFLFEEARQIVRDQNFSSWKEYTSWKGRPKKIPLKPGSIYEEYKGRRDWLGLDAYFASKKGYIDYESAQSILVKHSITSNAKFRIFKKSDIFPKDFPPNPPKYYKDIWKDRGGWGGFCNSGYVANARRDYMPFTEARDYAHSLKLLGKDQWFSESKKDSFPKNIPSAVHNVYKNEWKGWEDFLDNKDLKQKARGKAYMSYDEAKNVVCEMKFINVKEFQAWSKKSTRPELMPTNPYAVYRRTGEWKGWPDFLGKE